MKKGDIIKFGKYPQDEDGRVLPIEWIVLDVTGNEAFLISRYALDCREYNLSGGDITWEYCDLRKWLNTDFIKNAFSDEEAKNIKVSQLRNNDNPLPINFESMFPRAHGGNDTFDQVFCLSIDEVEKYLSNINNGIVCRPTAYIINRVLSNYFSGCCTWWLRSPGYHQDSAMYVSRDNIPDLGGCATFDKRIAVRPALRLALSSKENKEQKLVDVVRKTHNLQCGIFGNISDDLGDLPFSELSPMVRMAYAYARRFVAAGLYVQGVFSYDQYMYICTVFMSFQITTAKDANLLPGEDVSFQEDALRQAVELLITYDNRFNISFIKFFSTALSTQGKNFPVLPNGSSYEAAMNVIEKQIAVFTNHSPSNDIRENKLESFDNSNLEKSNKQEQIISKSITGLFAVIIFVIITIICKDYYDIQSLSNTNPELVENNNSLSNEIDYKKNVIEGKNLLFKDIQKQIDELKANNEKQKKYISELLEQQNKTDNTSYWTYFKNKGVTHYTLSKKISDYSLDLKCGPYNPNSYDWGDDMRIYIHLPNGKTIDNSMGKLTFVIDGKMYYADPKTTGRLFAIEWDNFAYSLFKGKHIEVIKEGKTITTFKPTVESMSLVKDADCHQQGW